MLTTVVAPGAQDTESACEPDEWLMKPVRRTRLVETVNRALGLAAPESRESGETSVPAIRSLGLRVLLVEDSPVNQEVAGGMLEALGCEVVTASDGTLGVEHALGQTFDVVLMDCQMPRMDGYEATRKIRAAEAANSRAAVPIVAITHDKLRQVQELLRREIPDGDPGAIFDRALTLLLEDVARKKVASTSQPRNGRAAPTRSRHIPRA